MSTRITSFRAQGTNANVCLMTVDNTYSHKHLTLKAPKGNRINHNKTLLCSRNSSRIYTLTRSFQT